MTHRGPFQPLPCWDSISVTSSRTRVLFPGWSRRGNSHKGQVTAIVNKMGRMELFDSFTPQFVELG